MTKTRRQIALLALISLSGPGARNNPDALLLFMTEICRVLQLSMLLSAAGAPPPTLVHSLALVSRAPEVVGTRVIAPTKTVM